MRLILAFLLISSTAFALGETPITMENLKRDIRTPEELSRWMGDNLTYRLYANDGMIRQRYRCLQTTVADCDDYAELAYDWLAASPYYTPILVCIGLKGGEGHVVVLFWHKGWKMFSNDKIIPIKTGLTYQDMAECYSRDWTAVIIYKRGHKWKTLYRWSDPLKLG